MPNELLARANRLERLAKLAQDSEGDKQNLERLKLAVDKLSGTVEKLGSVLATHRALDNLHVPRETTVDINTVFVTLRDAIGARGRPKPERLHRVNATVNAQVEELEKGVRSRWIRWTTHALNELPKHKVAALPQQDRARVERNLRSLEGMMRLQPSVTQVSAFNSLHRLVVEELGEIELSGPVLRVLERFTSPTGLALAELTDGDIAALRSDPSIEAQFVIRRQL